MHLYHPLQARVESYKQQNLFFLIQTLTALDALVTAVATVVGSVAHPAFGNTAMVPTLKLRGWAKLIWRKRNKVYKVHNKKLHRCSGAAWRTAVSLVCTVLTVVLLITGPTQRDAASTGTGKVSGVTVHFLPSCKQWPTSQTRDEHIHKFT